ncbi:aspartate carbamoyltransferase catalytic subunit [Candidatus Pacebacteria bacterium]|nr:aspartate carbamoyltransferase catalytic subunit [Candidatus Paceibacterota bacterium]
MVADHTTRMIELELHALRDKRDISFFDLVSIDDVSVEDMSLIFTLARKFKEAKTHKLSICKGHSQVNAFFEPSTRTQSSFDLSAKHLSMDTTGVSGSNGATKKGEGFLDTVQTLDAYNVKTIVIRASQAGVPEMAARHTKASILNAGDGYHEHPTQGLLDALTMLDYFETENLEGRVVTIVGDITHSRVFGSLVRVLTKLRATVRVAGPETFMPSKVENFGVSVYYNIEEAVTGADVVYALRVQEERGAKGFIPTLREYSKTFGISEKRLDMARPGAILMHPGPVIRDIDVHSALVSRHPKSRILEQVENGMAIRKAVLWLLCERYDGKRKDHNVM